jgi:hypothetical protein
VSLAAAAARSHRPSSCTGPPPPSLSSSSFSSPVLLSSRLPPSFLSSPSSFLKLQTLITNTYLCYRTHRQKIQNRKYRDVRTTDRTSFQHPRWKSITERCPIEAKHTKRKQKKTTAQTKDKQTTQIQNVKKQTTRTLNRTTKQNPQTANRKPKKNHRRLLPLPLPLPLLLLLLTSDFTTCRLLTCVHSSVRLKSEPLRRPLLSTN